MVDAWGVVDGEGEGGVSDVGHGEEERVGDASRVRPTRAAWERGRGNSSAKPRVWLCVRHVKLISGRLFRDGGLEGGRWMGARGLTEPHTACSPSCPLSSLSSSPPPLCVPPWMRSPPS